MTDNASLKHRAKILFLALSAYLDTQVVVGTITGYMV